MKAILDRMATHLLNDYALESDLAMALRDLNDEQRAELPAQFVAILKNSGIRASEGAIRGFLARRIMWADDRSTMEELDAIYNENIENVEDDIDYDGLICAFEDEMDDA